MRLASVEALLRKNRARAARAGTVEAVSESAGRIVRKLNAVNTEIKDVQDKIKEVVDQIKEAEDRCAVDILQSVPGIGATVLAVILSKAFDSVRLADAVSRLDSLILDELGYLPFALSEGSCCSI